MPEWRFELINESSRELYFCMQPPFDERTLTSDDRIECALIGEPHSFLEVSYALGDPQHGVWIYPSVDAFAVFADSALDVEVRPEPTALRGRRRGWPLGGASESAVGLFLGVRPARPGQVRSEVWAEGEPSADEPFRLVFREQACVVAGLANMQAVVSV